MENERVEVSSRTSFERERRRERKTNLESVHSSDHNLRRLGCRELEKSPESRGNQLRLAEENSEDSEGKTSRPTTSGVLLDVEGFEMDLEE